MREDPSNEVRWAILGQLRRLIGANRLPPEAIPQDIDRPPNLALAGLAIERQDADRSMALLERALEVEMKQPTADPEIVLIDTSNEQPSSPSCSPELHRARLERAIAA